VEQTIVGGLLLGIDRVVITEYSFMLAVPVMFGASLVKLLDFGLNFTSTELMVLAIGMITAFIVSLLSIKLLLKYIKKHDFKAFGWYRIILGIIVLLYS
jgi:undecaprenyl-diphosphatase